MKELVKLPEEYCMGIPNWDLQHAEIVMLLNDLLKIRKRNDKEQRKILAEVVDSLLRYAMIHFKYEENKMEIVKYDDIETHRSEHKKFDTKVKDIQVMLNGGHSVDVQLVATFLKDWFVEHMQVTDKKLADYVTKHGKDNLFNKESIKDKLEPGYKKTA